MSNVRILVVDDDRIKQGLICDVLRKVPLDEDVELRTTASIQGASQELLQNAFDLLILDLNIPTRDGESPQQDGGLKLLDMLSISTGLKAPSHIIGLTAYPDLAARYQKRFGDSAWHLIQFQIDSQEWEHILAKKLVHIAESKAGFESIEFQSDLGIITALHKPELAAVLELNAGWSPVTIAGDDSTYYCGGFGSLADRIGVVACCADGMGMSAATALAMKMVQQFRPRYLAIVGIAAGVSGNFGDVLIADQSWDYNSGKSKYEYLFGFNCCPFVGRLVFEPAPEPILLSPLLKTKIGAFRLKADGALGQIRKKWNGAKPTWPLCIQVGPMASGAAVLENRPLINQIKSRNRKLVGIELETFGVFTAARLATMPRPWTFSMKSICDFGDHRKGDEWQAYAAYTSAQVLYEFALDQMADKKGHLR